MAYRLFDLRSVWRAEARFTATGSVGLEVVNTDDTRLYYVVTDSDTLPAIPLFRAGRVHSGEAKPVGLTDGERLWLASETDRGNATVNY